ncbi:MAG TPA: hypothetical protein DHV68_07920 [Dehalococcoidia bacterium]|nr:hypothetical protein [Dehalococcoidia bacterium]
MDRRVAEAARLGFGSCVVPKTAGEAGYLGKVEVLRPANIAEAVRFALMSPESEGDSVGGRASGVEVRGSS